MTEFVEYTPPADGVAPRGWMINYKVGDTVYIETTGYGRVDGYEATVTKITPTGQINVIYNGGVTAKFGADGYMHSSGNTFYKPKIVNVVRWHVIDGVKRKRLCYARINKYAKAIAANDTDKTAAWVAYARLGDAIEDYYMVVE